jgi:hypothetical protein
MASMRSASFFLLSIIEHLRDKTIQHGSLGFYIINVQSNTHDALEFLDKVIVPRHQYQITRERFQESASSDIGVYDKLTIAMQVLRWLFVSLCAVFVLLNLGLDVLLQTMRPSNFPNKVDKTITTRVIYVLSICAMAIAIYFVCQIFLDSFRNARDDTIGRRDITYDGEQLFEPFENVDAIAAYYALSRTFKEKDNPTRNSDDIWTAYKAMTDGGKKALQIQDMLGEDFKVGSSGLSWKALVGKCTPVYVSEVEKEVASAPRVFVKGVDARTQLELNRLREIEETIKCWDVHYLRRELQTRATALYDIVAKNVEGGMPEMKLFEIVNEYIAPKFKVGDLFVMENVALKDPDALKQLSIKGVNSASEALYETMTREKSMLGFYSSKTKKCYALQELLPRGCVLRKEMGSHIFVRSFEDQDVFVEGADVEGAFKNMLPPELKAGETTVSPESVRRQCLANTECIGIRMEPTAMLAISDTPIDAAAITECVVKDKSCAMFKVKVSDLGSKMDAYSYLKKVEPSLKKWLIKLADSYQNALFFTNMLETLNNELSLTYQDTQVDLIMNRATEIFDDVDQVVRRKGGTTFRYLSKTRFVDKFNAMTIADFNEFHSNVVGRLATFLGILRNRFTWEMAKKASLDDNSMIVELRNIDTIKNYLIIAITVLGVFLVCFGIHLGFQSTDHPVLKAGKVAVALALVGVALCLIYAVYQKRRVSHEYNSDMLEMNSGKLINSITIIRHLCDDVQKDIDDKESPEIQLSQFDIPDDTKIDLYDDIVRSITMLERCNLLTLDLDKDIPFPVMEISINAAVIGLLLFVILVLIKEMRYSEVPKQISLMHTIIQKVSDFPKRYRPADFPELFCETHATSSVIIMGASLAVLFGIYLSQQLITYSNTYRIGLYNSKHYEDGRCVRHKQ